MDDDTAVAPARVHLFTQAVEELLGAPALETTGYLFGKRAEWGALQDINGIYGGYGMLFSAAALRALSEAASNLTWRLKSDVPTPPNPFRLDIIQ